MNTPHELARDSSDKGIGRYQRIRKMKQIKYLGRTKIKTVLLNISNQRFQQYSGGGKIDNKCQYYRVAVYSLQL